MQKRHGARKFGRRLAAALQRSLYVLVIVSLLAGSLPGLAVQAASAADAAPTPTDARLPFETAVATDVFEVTGTPQATELPS
ncbi:MAG: hypothetical protein ACOYYS_09435 [Chloroflexota bacterium]